MKTVERLSKLHWGFGVSFLIVDDVKEVMEASDWIVSDVCRGHWRDTLLSSLRWDWRMRSWSWIPSQEPGLSQSLKSLCTGAPYWLSQDKLLFLSIAERLFVIVLCHHNDRWTGYVGLGLALCTPAGHITTACPVSSMAHWNTRHSLVYCYYETLPMVVTSDHSPVASVCYQFALITDGWGPS